MDVQAKFFGGDEAFIAFVKDHFVYPTRCQDEGINGNVTLRFVVDLEGRVSNIVPLEETKTCPEFTAEAKRVLALSPRWMPGQINGNPVKSYRVVPINLTFE